MAIVSGVCLSAASLAPSTASRTGPATSITTYLENQPDDVIFNVLPLSFDYGLYQVLMAFQFGGTVVLERSFTLRLRATSTGRFLVRRLFYGPTLRAHLLC